MRGFLLLILLAPLPALAQDADPANQLIEGYIACAMGEGKPDTTVSVLGLFGWTSEDASEAGVVNFKPGVGTDTLAYMSATPDYCHVESTSLGTTRALELMGAMSKAGLTLDATETDAQGCTTVTLSNGVTAAVTSGGNDPTCTSDANSGVRFSFEAG